MPRLALALLTALLVAGSAHAFPSTNNDLSISFGGETPPPIVGIGQIGYRGTAAGGVIVSGAEGTRFENVPMLTLIESGTDPVRTEVARGTLHVLSGTVVWNLANASATLDLSASYAIAMGVPKLALGKDGNDTGSPMAAPPGAGFVLVSERVAGAATSSGGESTFLLEDAVVTVLGSDGKPVLGWEARTVNARAREESSPHASEAPREGDAAETLVHATGAFTAHLQGRVISGGSDAAAGSSLRVQRASEDRFEATLKAFAGEAEAIAGNARMLDGAAGMMKQTGINTEMLNGAMVVTSAFPGSSVEARYADKPFDVGPMSIIRGNMEVVWSEGGMELQGEPAVMMAANGFVVDEPARLGFFPIVSLLLWAGAVAAVVYYFVRRPPAGERSLKLRLLSLGAYLATLVAVFVVWDLGFAHSFGTSALGVLFGGGIAGGAAVTFGVLLAVELVLFLMAALLFALPVRIMLGVALRYLGRGKSFKGLASAGGLVALGVLGPFYALWLLQTLIKAGMGALGGGMMPGMPPAAP